MSRICLWWGDLTMQHPENPETGSPVAAPATGTSQPLKYRRHKGYGPKWFRRLRRRFGMRVPLRKILLFVAVIATVIAVGSLVLITDATNRINSTLDNLDRVVTSISSRVETGLNLEDFDRLQSSLNDVISTLGSVQRQVGIVRPLLRFDENVQGMLTSVDITQQLARSANELLEGVEPALFFLMGRQNGDSNVAQISSGERLVELIRIGRPRFLNAQVHLDNAALLIENIDTAQLSAAAVLQLEELQNFHEQLSSIQSILMIAPDLLNSALGLDGERSYLILAQNSDELRPSGGYISTYGWLTVRNGRIVDYNYSPTTATSPNPPPETMAEELNIPDWWIAYTQPIYAAWDGSWSPDFPTTAEMAMWFYNNGNNLHSPVDGVISIDIIAFEYILQALGEVTVPEYGIVVDTGNFRDVVYEIRAFGEGDVPHKRFLAALYRQIFADWQATTSNPQTSAAVLSALLRAVQEKHIMLSLTDKNVDAALALLGWTGRQAQLTGEDYLMVVDANLGNKSNSSIRRQIIYDVELQSDNSAISRTTILYDYPAAVAENDPAVNEQYHGRLDYNNLLQVYTPPKNTLIGDARDIFEPILLSNPTNSQIIYRLQVAYDNSERVQFSYTSPDVIQTVGEFSRYGLLLQKQPGTRAELVNVQVTLPSGTETISISPEPIASYNVGQPILEFRFEMASDKKIEIVYAQQQ
jgi:hypothetical protein